MLNLLYPLASSIRLQWGQRPSGTWAWSKSLSTGRGWSPPSQRTAIGRCDWGAQTNIVLWTPPRSVFPSRRSRRRSECLQITRRGLCRSLTWTPGLISTPSLGACSPRGSSPSSARVFVTKGRIRRHWLSQLPIMRHRLEDQPWLQERFFWLTGLIQYLLVKSSWCLGFYCSYTSRL